MEKHFCVQQVTNEALWGLTYLIICWVNALGRKCIQVGAKLSATYAINYI